VVYLNLGNSSKNDLFLMHNFWKNVWFGGMNNKAADVRYNGNHLIALCITKDIR
jgi:hypothetical protein